MKAQNILSTLLVLSSVALLTACNASNVQGSIDSSSQVDLSSNKAISYCNQASNSDITANLKVYVDSNNVVKSNYMYVRLSALPANFESGGSYISMWRWLATSSGQTYLDNTVLTAALVNKSGTLLTDWKSSLRWSELQALASSLGYTDAKTFFNNVNVLVDLRDAEGVYDVLKFSVYDATTNKATSQADALLPMFYANPAQYAVEADGQARASVLKNLHPFKNLSLTSEDAYKSTATSLCFNN